VGMDAARPRLAELLGALSLVTDLATGYPPETAVRACLLASRMAGDAGLGPQDRSRVFYTTLLRYVGCTASSHEAAIYLGGQDIEVNRRMSMIDRARPAEALPILLSLAGGTAGLGWVRAAGRVLAAGPRLGSRINRSHCEVAARMAERLGLDAQVRAALYGVAERWDGKGDPQHLAGQDVPLPTRYAVLAHVAAEGALTLGAAQTRALVRRLSGRDFDPALVAAFDGAADRLLAETLEPDVWERMLDAEPPPAMIARSTGVDDVARVFADVADLKSPCLHGHSTAVAALAETAARLLGMSPDDQTMLHRAGLLHDIGRTAVPAGVWDRPGPLSIGEWEQVRLHGHHSERILLRCAALAPLAALAGRHHERLDGTGYHRGAIAGGLDRASRVLAAADVYAALVQARPHRPAYEPAAAAAQLEAMASSGALDVEAAAAVCQAAGQRRSRPRPARPAGLTEREVEVLRLLARGANKTEIARDLFISRATVHTHVVHIYAKTHVSSRAAVALFAMEHDLLG
jgi:putative nucleotidyltransferase with HDIG domain